MKFGLMKRKRSAAAAPDEMPARPVLRRVRGLRAWTVLSVIVCVLVAAVGTTVAWYAHTRRVEQNTLRVTSQAAELRIGSYAILKATPDDAGGVASAGFHMDTVNLNECDAVFADNGATPLYIRVELEGSGLQPSVQQTFQVTLTRENVPVPVDEIVPSATPNTTSNGLHLSGAENAEKMYTYLSNIVQAQWVEGSALDAIFLQDTVDARALALYQTAGGINTWSEPQSFYTDIPEPNGRNTTIDGIDKGNTLTMSVTLTPDANGKASFYIKLDYCWPLVEAFVNMQFGTSRRLDQSVEVDKFTGDITTIVVEPET